MGKFALVFWREENKHSVVQAKWIAEPIKLYRLKCSDSARTKGFASGTKKQNLSC